MNDEFGSEYGDLELVAGAFVGARSFKVDRLGRLVAKHQPYIWTPGENVAECLKSVDLDTYLMRVATQQGIPLSNTVVVGGAGGGGVGNSGAYGIPQVFPVPNKYTWGTTSNQFTFTPAQGSAYSPYSVDYDFPYDKLVEQAQKLMAEDAKNAGHRAADLNCQCGFYAYFDDGQNTYFEQDKDVLGVIEAYGQVTVGNRGFKCEKARIVALLIVPDRAFALRLVRRNYPDVAIFESKAAMLAEFPLTPQDPPGPDADPDFWTRAV